MTNFTKVAFAAFAMAFISCNNDGNDSEPSGNCESDIEWFQEGKFQSYAVKQFGFNAGTMKMTFGECTGGGRLTSRQVYGPDGALASETEDLIKEDGDFLISDVGNDGEYWAKLYKKNAALGETWSVTRLDGSIVTPEVVDTDSIVTVPAGTFHCKVYKYTTTTAINDSYIFWNDETGQIKEDAGFMTLELTEHN